MTVRYEFVSIPSRRFVTVGLDIDDVHGASLDSDEDVTDAIVKVRYRATAEQARRIDHAEIRRGLYEAGAHHVFAIQADIEREQRAKVAELDDTLDELAALDLYLHSIDLNGARAAGLRERTAGYLSEARR